MSHPIGPTRCNTREKWKGCARRCADGKPTLTRTANGNTPKTEAMEARPTRTTVRHSSPPAAIFSFARPTRSKPCTDGTGKPTLTRTANGHTPKAEATGTTTASNAYRVSSNVLPVVSCHSHPHRQHQDQALATSVPNSHSNESLIAHASHRPP